LQTCVGAAAGYGAAEVAVGTVSTGRVSVLRQPDRLGLAASRINRREACEFVMAAPEVS
jgi:hypothetical protein